MQIISIANCALHIKGEHKQILIDALISEKSLFAKIPIALEEDIMGRRNGYENIDRLFFTHSHDDHFDLGKCHEYMEKFGHGKILLPDSKLIKDGLVVDLGSMKITYHKGYHIGLKDSIHYSLLIEEMGKSILVTADSELDINWFYERFYGQEIDAAFFNPVVLGSSSSRKVLNLVKPKMTYIYHLLPKELDSYNYYKMASNNLKTYAKDLPDCRLITDICTELAV